MAKSFQEEVSDTHSAAITAVLLPEFPQAINETQNRPLMPNPSKRSNWRFPRGPETVCGFVCRDDYSLSMSSPGSGLNETS